MKKNNALLELSTTDLTLLHHPCTTTAETIERWLELEAGLAAGLTKAIGVSNFNAELLAEIAADKRTKVVPAVNQCTTTGYRRFEPFIFHRLCKPCRRCRVRLISL